ncbi:multicopy suppressor of ts gsp1 [Agyrium rufum]|nr:multicopy suppressor of ts gsp1 [Agyrium rufum]
MGASRTTQLFGGKLKVELPANFEDASKLRQIPNNQEVFLDRDGFTSIIIEVNERVEETDTLEALKYHLEDVVDGGDQIRTWQASNTQMLKLPNLPAATLLATVHPSDMMDTGKEETPKFTAMIMLIIRLTEQAADILITINVPHSAGSYKPGEINLEDGQPGGQIRAGLDARESIRATFEIVDMGLFGS